MLQKKLHKYMKYCNFFFFTSKVKVKNRLIRNKVEIEN